MTNTTDRIATLLDRIAAHWPEASGDQVATTVAVQRLARLLGRVAADALTPLDLSPAEFELLAALRSNAPPHRLTPTELYDAMLISSGGLTKLLKGLQQRGLVARPPNDTDRRSRPVALTPEGHALAERAMAEVQAAEAPLHDAMEAAWMGTGDKMARGLVALADAADRKLQSS